MNKEYIVKCIKELPNEVANDLLYYIKYLRSISPKKEENNKGFSFDWEGSLSELADQYTSMGLQHKAMEWR